MEAKWHAEVVYRSGAHTKHRLKYHLVFVPKYRKRVLRGKISKRVKDLFYQAAEVNDWGIERLEVLPDHLHMLIQLNPDLAVSKVVQLLKGGSSRAIRADFPELEEFLWGDSFWGDGYFAESVGKVEEEIVTKYIQEQKIKHTS